MIYPEVSQSFPGPRPDRPRYSSQLHIVFDTNAVSKPSSPRLSILRINLWDFKEICRWVLLSIAVYTPRVIFAPHIGHTIALHGWLATWGTWWSQFVYRTGAHDNHEPIAFATQILCRARRNAATRWASCSFTGRLARRTRGEMSDRNRLILMLSVSSTEYSFGMALSSERGPLPAVG